jgi:hypothetical protein
VALLLFVRTGVVVVDLVADDDDFAAEDDFTAEDECEAGVLLIEVVLCLELLCFVALSLDVFEVVDDL